MHKGSLSVVGTGILTPAHLSMETINWIKTADVVHMLVPDALGFSTIEKINDKIKNLADLYFDPSNNKNGNNRLEAYDLMVKSIIQDVQKGLKVCAIFYGHPGVFAYPSHQSINQARQLGFEAKMLPAISADACLFAELGVDPGDFGCQSYEANQLLFYQHSINVYSSLIIWQVGVVGDLTLTKLAPAENGLQMMQEYLLSLYPKDHKVILFESTTLPTLSSRRESIQLGELSVSKVKTITSLYLKPISPPPINRELCERWNIDTSSLE